MNTIYLRCSFLSYLTKKMFSCILTSNPILKLGASSYPPINSFAHISTLHFTIITKLGRMVVESNIFQYAKVVVILFTNI